MAAVQEKYMGFDEDGEEEMATDKQPVVNHEQEATHSQEQPSETINPSLTIYKK